MTDVTVDQSGVTRTAEGAIAEPTKPTPTPTTSTTTETKPDSQTEGKTLLTEKTEDAKVVPEKYDFKPPEDWKDKGWELDPATIEAAAPIFKELGLTNDQAQKLVSFYAEQSAKDHQSNLNLVAEQTKAWADQVKADPEIGPKLAQVKTVVGRALDSLGSDLANAFRKAMDETGVGNHPAFVKALYKLAEKVTEGTHVAGKGPAATGQSRPGSAPRTIAEALYPNLSGNP